MIGASFVVGGCIVPVVGDFVIVRGCVVVEASTVVGSCVVVGVSVVVGDSVVGRGTNSMVQDYYN